MANIVVIHSGGLDSTVLLYDMLDSRHNVKALSFNYGQRHSKELERSAEICAGLGVEHTVADLRNIAHLLSNSALTSQIPVPHGHYAADNMKATVVPNRNMIMLAVAAGFCINSKFDGVAYGAHAGDHAIYPDCRPLFVGRMRDVLGVCDYDPVILFTPFIMLSKTDIVRKGMTLKVPFEKTWSCYEGGDIHCGRCGTCCERLEAFSLCQSEDLAPYSDREYWKTVIK